MHVCVCVCVYVQDYFRRQLGARPGGDVDQMSSDMESHVESTMALIRSSAPSPLLLSTLVYAFDTPDEVKAMPQSRLAIYTMAARTYLLTYSLVCLLTYLGWPSTQWRPELLAPVWDTA